MITRAQVADLREGDEIEIREASWPVGSVIRGRLYVGYHQALHVAGRLVAYMDGSGPTDEREGSSLTVVSRAPRPLYVNHPRMNPLPGDVVRMENDGGRVVMLTEADGWLDRHGHEHDPKRKDGLRLLVDGETGQVVPS